MESILINLRQRIQTDLVKTDEYTETTQISDVLELYYYMVYLIYLVARIEHLEVSQSMFKSISSMSAYISRSHMTS